MANAGNLSISAVDMMKNVTLEVTVTKGKQLAIRMWLGIHLIKLAAWVMNIGNIQITEQAR